MSSTQRALVESLTERLSRITGMRAVVLGGSHARGRARPDSDIDLGLLYREDAPFAIDDVGAIARQVNDTPEPVVTGFYQWGHWVNGGSWLTIAGQRVDFLYKNLDQLARVIHDAQAGRYEHDYGQQPPFGFYSDTYLSELETCIALYDPEQILSPLKHSIARYPEPLRVRLIQDGVGSAAFDLYGATQAAKAADSYLTSACLTRIINRLVQALFAINRRYRVNDKTTFLELADCQRVPHDFCARVQAVASHAGAQREELLEAVERVRALLSETAKLGSDALVIDEQSPAWLRHLEQGTGGLRQLLRSSD